MKKLFSSIYHFAVGVVRKAINFIKAHVLDLLFIVFMTTTVNALASTTAAAVIVNVLFVGGYVLFSAKVKSSINRSYYTVIDHTKHK